MRWHHPLAVLFLAACGDGDASSGPDARTDCAGFVGDRSLPVDLEVIVAELAPSGGSLRPVSAVDGLRVPLIPQPTGAVALFVGARVKNVDTCAINVAGRLGDATENVSFNRPIAMVKAQDGWAEAAHSADAQGYLMLFACPNHWSSRDVYENSYPLEVTVTDSTARTAKKTLSIVPFCGDPDHQSQCLNDCKAAPL